MITVSISKLVGDAFGKGSYADKLIHLKGYPYLDNREEEVLGLLAKEVMTPSNRLTCLKASGMTLGVLKVLLQSPMTGLPVIASDDMAFLGYMAVHDLNAAIGTPLNIFIHCTKLKLHWRIHCWIEFLFKNQI